MMDEWESLFSPRILVRGMDYYESGAVMEMVRTEGGYRALVEGTEDYKVEIDIKDNQVQHMRCTCPYAAEGYNCKHMAAVLYEAEEGGVLEMPPTADGGTVQDYRQELKDVINGIPEEELRRLLESMAWEDGKLRNKILIQYSPSISQRQMAMLKREINDIAYGYSDRYGYVDWENAGNYLLEMEAFLNDKVQAVIDKGCWMQAFELTNQVFITIGNQDIDHSDGGLGMVAEACYEFWKQILEKCSEQDKDRMRAWFKKYQADGTVTDYLEEYISGFLMNELHDRELLQRTMEALDQEIEKNREGMDCGKYYSVQYGFEYNILKRLQIMKELGASEEEILQYREENRRFTAVRMLEIEEFIQAGQYKDAIRVLKESKELDHGSPSWVSGHSRKLIELYGRLHMDKDYKEELLFQVFSCRQDSLDFTSKLKAVCGKSEWEQIREKLLAGPAGQEIKLPLLESEKMYGQLLKEVVNSGSVYTMDRYEKVLKKMYPDRMRTAYTAFARGQAESASDRTRYKELMKYLKKIASYPNGLEAAAQLAQEWRTLYKRRRAMMDELGKAGF